MKVSSLDSLQWFWGGGGGGVRVVSDPSPRMLSFVSITVDLGFGGQSVTVIRLAASSRCLPISVIQRIIHACMTFICCGPCIMIGINSVVK
jgi:hypothetical protein